jgi:hypothetical protein
MESSILSEVDDTSILRTGLPTPLWSSSQLLLASRLLPPRSGLERSDFVPWHECEAEGGAKPVRLCPCSSDLNLFSYGQGIVNFNTEIPDGALDLRVSRPIVATQLETSRAFCRVVMQRL